MPFSLAPPAGARLLTRVLGLAFLGLALFAPVSAQESACAADLAKACEKIAKEHEKIAKWADKAGLYRQGFLEWSDVIEFDRDNKEGRERLGYEKTDSGWVKSRAIEVKKVNEIDESESAELENNYERKRKEVKDKALKELEKVLASANKASDTAVKEKSAKLIRRYDPYHKGAIGALGLEIGEDGRPVEPELPTEPEPEPAPGTPEAPPGTPNDGSRQLPTKPGLGAIRTATLPTVIEKDAKHPWAAKAGLPIESVETTHTVILYTDMEAEMAKAIADVAEQTRARFFRRYLIPNDVEFYPRKITVLYLADKKEHQAFCDTVYHEDVSDESAFQFTRDRAGGATFPKHFAAWAFGEGQATASDFAAHYCTHLITGTFNGGLPIWIREAVSYEQSIGLLGTSWTSCINDEMTGDREKKWSDPVNWKELVRGLVRLEEDTPFSSIVGFRPNEIDPKIAAKCWSFLTWLLDTQGEKVYPLLMNLRGDDEASHDPVFKGIFGKTLGELEQEWRRYVKENY